MAPKARYPPGRHDEQYAGEGDDHSGEEDEDDEEEGEEVVDLNDPENRVIEDDGSAPSDHEDEADEPHAADGEGDDAEEEQPPAPKEPKIPQFQDALTFVDKKKPLHALDTAVINGVTYVACGGENDCISILALEQVAVEDTDGSRQQYRLREVAELAGHTDTITHLAFSPTGEYLASGAMDCRVIVWRTETWALAHDLRDLSGEIECLLWHKSGLVLVAGAADAQLVMWNVRKGEVAQYLVGHADGVSAAVWSLPDQKKLLTGSSGGAFVAFNPKTGQPEVSIMRDVSKDNTLVSAILPLTEDIAVVGCEDGTMHLVSLASGRVVKHLPELHDQCVECIISHPTKPQFFATCSCDCKIIVWNSATFDPRATFTCHEGVTKIVWHGDFLVATGTEGDVTLWEGLASSTDVPLGRPLQGHTETITGVSVVAGAGAEDRRPLIVTASDDGTVRVFPLAIITAAA